MGQMSRVTKIIMGIVAIVVFSILIPIILPAIDTIIANANIATFPGVSVFTGLVPLMAVLGGLGSGGFLVYSGIRDRGGSTADMMQMIWGIIVIFVFLILFPLVLDNFYTLYGLMGPPANYTGYQVIPIIPMIIEAGTLFGSGLLMFQGITGKRVWSRKRGGRKGRRN